MSKPTLQYCIHAVRTTGAEFFNHARSRLTLGFSVLALTACSALQIDVDVYKGPLANDPVVQARQFAGLAISARPLLENLCRKTYVDGLADTGNDPKQTGKYVERYKLLYHLLAAYEDKPSLLRVPESSCPRPASTDDRAALSFGNLAFMALNVDKFVPAAATRKGLRSLDENLRSDMELNHFDLNSQKVQQDLLALNDALIRFAEEMLYFANSEAFEHEITAREDHWWWPTPDGQNIETTKAFTRVLQSLGNTLIVHANDLTRQRARKHQLESYGAAESAALDAAFGRSGVMAFAAMRQELSRRATAPALAASSVQAAPDATLVAAQRLAESELSTYVSNQQGLNAFYRSLLGDWHLDPSVPASKVELVDNKLAASDRAWLGQQLLAFKPQDLSKRGTETLTHLSTSMGQLPTSPALRADRLKSAQEFLTLLPSTLVELLNGATSGTQAYQRSKGWLLDKKRETLLQLGALQETVSAAKAAVDSDAHKVLAQKSQGEKEDKARVIAKKAGTVFDAVNKDLAKQFERGELKTWQEVQVWLRAKLADPKSVNVIGKADEISAASAQLTLLAQPVFQVCSTEPTAPNADCLSASNQIEQLDQLIINLRAMRMAATRDGSEKTAQHLLEAINQAYDQRTALIHLRPASDYLRSVYAATSLQYGTQDANRNMLVDYMHYLDPFPHAKSGDKIAHDELEKLFWQNINQVSVGGGGNTNYVLAKDDVGNWYVKEYSADPEPIIKAATSLALFNSGRAINTNLLRRYELQRQVDDTSASSTDRQLAREELTKTDSQEGSALLKIQSRYAERYRADSLSQVGAINAAMIQLPLAMKNLAHAAIDKDKAASGKNVSACLNLDVDPVLDDLETLQLKPSRDTLSLLAAAEAGTAKPVINDLESALNKALLAIRQYGLKASTDLAAGKIKDCESVSPLIAQGVRAAALTLFTSEADRRRSDIARYEDALSNVAEIANSP